MKKRRLMALAVGTLIALGAIFGAVSQVRAVTYYVDWNNMSPLRPYTNSVSGAARVIEVVLPYAQDGDTIIVRPATYPQTSTTVITKNLDIRNENGSEPELVIFDGEGLYTCFNLGDTDTVLTGFTIRNAKTAGIRCTGSSPLISDCIIEDTAGTGMVLGQAERTIFRNNTGASNGGGAYGTIAIDCSFINNQATKGGGGYGVTATGCSFQNNAASTDGGGLYDGTATNSLFVGNSTGGSGGGLRASTAVGCAISGNSAFSHGGGLYQSTATHCTITENTARIGGGMGDGQAYNSILWNNSVTDHSASIDDTDIYSCCLPDNTDNGSITNNPQLISFSHLTSTSPCMGAGDPAYATATDIDGDAWQTLPAIGCDEVETGSTVGWIQPYNDLYLLVSGEQEILFTAYVDGPVTQTILDFGDGTAITNSTDAVHSHSWAFGSNYHVTLTGYNDSYPDGRSITNTINVRRDSTSTIYVSTADGLDTNDGDSWATAKKTIQSGIDAQDFAGGLVLVSNGTYSVSDQIVIDKDIRLESLYGSEQTTIEGNAQNRIFHLGNQHCRVNGFTIRNGRSSDPSGGTQGGTIYCTSNDPVVEDCLITSNTSDGGGAMWRGTATNCVFSFNDTSGNGPGAMQDGIAIDCRFENNKGTGGGAGGGAMGGGAATRCIFKNNTNVNAGGAMYGGQAYDCQFIENSSDNSGGGAYNTDAENCVFNGNKANRLGGGMSSGSATHCTFTANRASTGGGTYNTTLDHSIVWFNEALEAFDNTAYGIISSSCSPDLEHGTDGNITNMPQLVSASHIKLSSPCAGSGSRWLTTLDIDGEHWRSVPAIGCDEPADPPTGDVAISIVGPAQIPAGFNAFYTIDFQGAFEQDQIDFGDGYTATGSGIIPFGHTWDTPGTYNMISTVWNNNYQDTYSVTNQITVYVADYKTIHVSPSGDDSKSGLSWSDAKQTIQAAIDEQELHGGRVVVSNGVYTLTETISIDKEIQLLSANGAESTIIDGVDLYSLNYQHSRIMEIGDNHSTVDGFTLRNANFIWTGGAVFCDYTFSPILSNCIIADNHAGTAGGMCYGTVIDCTFSNNTATTGAGLYLGHATRCEFIANTASGSGGGMYAGTADRCTFVENRTYNTISYGNGAGMSHGIANNCTFTRNDSDGYGGGINEGTANDCLFIENVAVHGGGMRNSVANRCSFFENSAATSGGAIHNGTATRCTISGNRATLGGGMHGGTAYACAINGNIADDIGGGTHSTKLYNCTVTGNSASETGGVLGQTKNCIVWGNTAITGKNDINDENIYLNYIVNTCSPDAPHGTDGCITNNPLLISSSHIAANSPCIGKGDAADATGTDLDGEVWNTPPAMGCDEIGETLSGPIEMALFGPSPIAVYVEGNYAALFNGQVSRTIVDFGDGTRITNAVGVLSHSWAGPNSADYDVILTAFNETYPQGISYTQTVAVVNRADSDIYVKHFGNDTDDGTSWASAKQTIQAGVDAQNIYGGRVLIDASTYAITETINVNKAVHLKGDNDDIIGTLTIPVIDAGGSNRCFQLGYSACVLENLVIQNGEFSSGYGGGIYCQNGAPRITYSTITDCTAYYGGGIYKGTVENCTLANNIATSQGGAAYQSTLEGSTLSGNTAQYGGGLYDGTLTGCTLSNNTATTQGGAAYDSTVIFSTISSNAAPSGGGLANCMADRCDISTNRATANGGGMYLGTAHNCTIHYNSSTQYGGGTYNTALRNCTVVENGADTGGGSYAGSVYNSIIWSNFAWTANIDLRGVTAKNTCSPDLIHGQNGNITNAPLFIALAPDWLIRGSDYYLDPFSPCINAGDNSYVETDLDFNGWDRIQHGTVEMGAIEGWVSNGDYDADGLDDGWELEYFGGITNAVADAHSDSDIFNNLEESIAGTDPLDGLDYLHITEQQMTNDSVIIRWEAKKGRAYDVAWAETLTNEYDFIGFNLYYPIDSYADTNHFDKASGFYKIRVKN
ncbi:right-handed parallel beta-helix repeat-containing protein [Pontiella sulfatireligans]|uniref:Right handed beta helix domain-containing protein n=1 Tax=Pontiella sulfatireligans TaxID=2750658 RepID=A0A6C2UHE0_9BACT|nr:right-handed parallel beta-helix repeat-containing protein [Pontiella sulfatireligans]VGO18764.1 hypothetical protein SCARR_00817 [Pontiella sulfatireligans]